MVEQSHDPFLFAGGAAIGNKSPMKLSFLAFAELPPAENFPGGLAFTSDQGLVVSNAATWSVVGSGSGGFSPGSGLVYTSFVLRLINNGGALQHRILSFDSDAATPAPFVSTINGASETFTNTPTGPDTGTPFAAGLKRSSALNALLIFDTADQGARGSNPLVATAAISQNITGTPINCRAAFDARNVNGVTQRRLELALTNAATGTLYDFNTSNFSPGQFVDVNLSGFLVGFAP